MYIQFLSNTLGLEEYFGVLLSFISEQINIILNNY